MKVKSLSRVRLSMTPWTAAYQAPLPMGFSRQEHWSGVPLPSLSFMLRGEILSVVLFHPPERSVLEVGRLLLVFVFVFVFPLTNEKKIGS